MKILLTGFSGFIGFHLTKRLLSLGHIVYGFDDLSQENSIRRRILLDSLNNPNLRVVLPFDQWPEVGLIIHLAAKPGVQLSQTSPELYLKNISFFLEVLQNAKYQNVRLIYASSSSADDPQSFYGLTKKTNEETARLLYPSVGLRFFTVFGPWGRSDMGYWKFTKAILEDKPIELWGNYTRDFTYVDDIVDGIIKAFDLAPGVYEVGSNRPLPVQHMIYCLEKCLGKKANVQLISKPDREATHAVNSIITAKVSFEEGIEKFVSWYKEFMV